MFSKGQYGVNDGVGTVRVQPMLLPVARISGIRNLRLLGSLPRWNSGGLAMAAIPKNLEQYEAELPEAQSHCKHLTPFNY